MCISGLIHVSLASGTVNCLDQQNQLFFLFFNANLGKKNCNVSEKSDAQRTDRT